MQSDNLKIRNSVKVLLLNDKKKLLLIYVNDPKTTTTNGKYHGSFWNVIGGEIEEGETIFQTALREVYEEAGIHNDQIKLGPVVWFGEFDLVLSGVMTKIKQKFIVAKTKQNKTSLDNLTEEEKLIVSKLKWFSLDEIKNCDEIIYPVVLSEYIEDVIDEKYLTEPIEIDLSKQP